MASQVPGPLYHAPGLSPPQLDDLRTLNSDLKLRCPDQQLKEMAEVMTHMTESFQRVSEMLDTSVPVVKYPRTPGHRPLHEDNPHNAWAWRCDIQGASGGKLSGKTVAIKDNTAVAGVPMRNGSKILDGYVPEFDATVVTRILDAGGRILGKSSTEDMCLSGTSILNTDGPVTHPLDPTRVTGGSSSGSATLVALRSVDMAIGGDQGGSIRIPASFTGIVGLKPTWGLVPYTGASSIEPTVDHLGPMAATVTDCALLLEVIAGYDGGRDNRQDPSITVPEYTRWVDEGVAGLKVGLLTEGFDQCMYGVRDTVRTTASRLAQEGCTVEDVSVPMHTDGKHIWSAVAGQGALKCALQGNGTGFSSRGFYPLSMQEATARGLRSHPHDMQPLFKSLSLYMHHVDDLYGNRFYAKGQNLTLQLTEKYDAALRQYDVLVLPTLPHPAPKIPKANCSFVDLFNHAQSMNCNTKPFNLTGHPALSLNAGFCDPGLCAVVRDNKMPVGLMVVGRKFDETTVFRVARAVERLVDPNLTS